MRPVVVSLVASCALAACVSAPPRAPSPVAQQWVEYALILQGLGVAELDDEYRTLEQQQLVAPAADSAIKLALISADTRSAFYDLDRSLDLLGAVVRDSSAAATDIAFAGLMRGWVGDLARLQSMLDSERAERAALEQQLQALIALEERLNETVVE